NRRNPHRLRKRDINTTVTLVIMAIVQCMLYVPCSITWTVYTLAQFLPTVLTKKTELIVLELGRYFVSLTIFTKLWNLYLYIFRIRGFREDSFDIIVFKCRHNPNNFPQIRSSTRIPPSGRAYSHSPISNTIS